MSEKQKNDTVDNLIEDGRDLLSKANRRHIVVRDRNNATLLDLNMTTVAIIVFLMFLLQPLGTFVAICAIAYGLIRKVKVEIVRELTSDDDVIDVKLPQE